MVDDSKWQKEAISSFQESVFTTSDVSKSSLVILQGECGSINGTRFDCIGTLFATTCHIAFFMDKSRSTVVCAHLDEGLNVDQIQCILSLFDAKSIDLYLIGGYLDEKRTSIKVTDKLLYLLSTEKQFKDYNVNLCLLFTASLNTQYTFVPNSKGMSVEVPIPKYQSIGYNLKENRFVSLEAVSGQNVPHYTLRSAVLFDLSNHHGLRVVYDCNDERYIERGPTIDAFKWKRPYWVRNILQSKMGDHELLQMFSTSPYAEHDGFAQDSRALFQYILQNEPKDVFAKGKPIHFQSGIIKMELLRGDSSNNADNSNPIIDNEEVAWQN